MNKIYKLVSIFIALTLISTTAIAAKPIPTPTSNPEQVQNTRLTTLETNDTLQNTNNSAQQGLINGLINNVNTIKTQIISLTDQINQLINRVTNLENDPYPRLYTMNYNVTTFLCNPSPEACITQLATLTFTLPKDATVQVQVDGRFDNWGGWLDIGFFDYNADGVSCIDPICGEPNYGLSTTQGQRTGFEQSKAGYFKAGTHTIKVSASESLSFFTVNSQAWTRISATAYDVNKAEIHQPQ
jgi:hypothetical protein